jgi:threonine/homoserine/homoserine lactone efflux protein
MNNNAFAINGFTGMTHDQKVSFFIVGGITTLYCVLIAASFVAFYSAAKPRHGRVPKSAFWHIIAMLIFMLSTVTLIWAAPAEKSFFNDATRTHNVIFGLVFAAVGVLCMVLGAAGTSMAKSARREQAFANGPPGA